MEEPLPKIILRSCPKAFTRDLDKAENPMDTIRKVRDRLAAFGEDIYAGSRRVDNGRLGIPVYMGICGKDARTLMPARKQMGKGASPEQAEASALMELMERYAFFSFWERPGPWVRANWAKAEKLFGGNLLPVAEMLKSVQDDLCERKAKELLNLFEWNFYPSTNLASGETVWAPLDWFRMLGEFNGSSAGNTPEESLLQGLSELVERHVSAIVDRDKPELATIDASSFKDPTLKNLHAAFMKNGVNLVLKDISLGMPLPTIAALAWDPATFPQKSEIVFTAGTASSPEKAAIRAITEVAQLGGDFCSGSCYEASGLPKFKSLEDCRRLSQGSQIPIDSLPDISNPDIREELRLAVERLAPLQVYAVETTHPGLAVSAHYCFAPGLEFRERDKNSSLGLFVGRKLAEEAEIGQAEAGLDDLAKICDGAPFISFFRGLLALRKNEPDKAANLFSIAVSQQGDEDSAALAAFYAGYAKSQSGDWSGAKEFLELALRNNPQMKEAENLLGVAFFKLESYEDAESCFDRALAVDRGSAVDLANRGIARKCQGKIETARQDLADALELEPDLDFARKHLAELDKLA